ncbi:MAG TPA: glycosyltransferase family 2 protein [Methylomirabilota bacterium]|nr:glycosyltransferase family 2 protein [Methylomirabilota bacterium]
MSVRGMEGVSAIVPVLDEHDNLEPLHAQLSMALKALGRDYEIVYVDDGSTDGSWDVLKRLAASDRAVRLVRLRRNFGQTAALSAGLAHSSHPIVVTLDGDLQNDPGDIAELIEALDRGDDVVCGWRRHRHDPWLTRRLPSALANRLIRWLTGVRLHDIGCTLRAYRREVLSDVHLYGDMHRYLPVLVAWVGGRIGEIEVAHHPRAAGKSKYGLLRIFRVLVDLITIKFLGDFAVRPNTIFGGFGLLSIVAGFGALAVVLYRIWVLGRVEATPMVFLMVVCFLTGVLSVLIGFLADIVIRGFYETQRKAAYYVRETDGMQGVE